MQNKSIQKTGRLHLQLTGFSQQGDKQCSKRAKAILKYLWFTIFFHYHSTVVYAATGTASARGFDRTLAGQEPHPQLSMIILDE